jgi:hypothetical protein
VSEPSRTEITPNAGDSWLERVETGRIPWTAAGLSDALEFFADTGVLHPPDEQPGVAEMLLAEFLAGRFGESDGFAFFYRFAIVDRFLRARLTWLQLERPDLLDDAGRMVPALLAAFATCPYTDRDGDGTPGFTVGEIVERARKGDAYGGH